MRIDSIQIGQPRSYGREGAEDPFERRWTSAIRKELVTDRIWVGALGLSGDRVASTKNHGGPDRALLMYSAEHYPKWRTEWRRPELAGGAFGENLTVTGLTEGTVCVGDVFGIGEVLVEVSAPRNPCINLSRRHGMRDLVDVINLNHRSGWYLRVQKEGWLENGVSIDILDRPYPQWTIVRAAEVMQARRENPSEAILLSDCPALIPGWRAKLTGTS